MSHPIVPILGAGESGTGAALLAVRQGLQPWVSDAGAVSADRAAELDAAGVEWEANGHDEARIIGAANRCPGHQKPGHPRNRSTRGARQGGQRGAHQRN